MAHVSEKIGHGQTLNDENSKEWGGQGVDCANKNTLDGVGGFEGAFTNMVDNTDKADKTEARDER